MNKDLNTIDIINSKRKSLALRLIASGLVVVLIVMLALVISSFNL
ncbi:MAG: hypothetical protein ACRC4L_02435 [Mycoplasma sp.]